MHNPPSLPPFSPSFLFFLFLHLSFFHFCNLSIPSSFFNCFLLAFQIYRTVFYIMFTNNKIESYIKYLWELKQKENNINNTMSNPKDIKLVFFNSYIYNNYLILCLLIVKEGKKLFYKTHSVSEIASHSVVPGCLWSMDCSLPGSSAHGILYEKILEWITIPFFRASSWPRDQTQVSRIAGRFFTIWDTRQALVSVI